MYRLMPGAAWASLLPEATRNTSGEPERHTRRMTEPWEPHANLRNAPPPRAREPLWRRPPSEFHEDGPVRRDSGSLNIPRRSTWGVHYQLSWSKASERLPAELRCH